MTTAGSAAKPWFGRPFLGLLISLITLWCVVPFLPADHVGPRPGLDVLVSLVLLGGVSAATGSRRFLRVAVALGGLALTLRWVVYASEQMQVPALISTLAFLGFIAFTISEALRRQHRVSADTISGGICVYLLLGLLWALGYQLVEQLVPGSLHHPPEIPLSTPDLYYFSLVTMTTLGYGDVHPVQPVSRMLAAAQAVFGQLFVAIFIARLVGLYTAQQMHHEERS